MLENHSIPAGVLVENLAALVMYTCWDHLVSKLGKELLQEDSRPPARQVASPPGRRRDLCAQGTLVSTGGSRSSANQAVGRLPWVYTGCTIGSGKASRADERFAALICCQIGIVRVMKLTRLVNSQTWHCGSRGGMCLMGGEFPRKASSLSFSKEACVLSWDRLTLCSPMDYNLQTPLSMGFLRQEYWGGLSFSLPGDLSAPGIKLKVSCSASNFFTIWATWEALPKEAGKTRPYSRWHSSAPPCTDFISQ